jgi:hypothetical protein
MDRRALKFITFKGPDGTIYPVIFPPILTHKDVSRQVVGLFFRESVKVEPVGAGFVEGLEDASAYGQSISMDLKSDRERDSAAIAADWEKIF